jgi:hypothetical protein
MNFQPTLGPVGGGALSFWSALGEVLWERGGERSEWLFV